MAKKTVKLSTPENDEEVEQLKTVIKTYTNYQKSLILTDDDVLAMLALEDVIGDDDFAESEVLESNFDDIFIEIIVSDSGNNSEGR